MRLIMSILRLLDGGKAESYDSRTFCRTHALRDFSPRSWSSRCQSCGRREMDAVTTASGRGLRPAPLRLPPRLISMGIQFPQLLRQAHCEKCG